METLLSERKSRFDKAGKKIGTEIQKKRNFTMGCQTKHIEEK